MGFLSHTVIKRVGSVQGVLVLNRTIFEGSNLYETERHDILNPAKVRLRTFRSILSAKNA